MQERYGKEIPKWLRILGAWRINRESIDFKWGYFAPRAGLKLVLHRGTYFDRRWAVSFALGWGVIHVYLPLTTSLEEGCDMPQYGFAIHNDTFWIYRGGKYENGECQDSWIAWNLPFFSWVFEGHWIRDKDYRWVKMGRSTYTGNIYYNIQPWDFRKECAYTETHPYTYQLKSGAIQHRTALCTIEKRRWYRKWFPFLTRTEQVIDIEFNDEVGERTGSWKGGTIGCSYKMRPQDTIESCLRRMERERSF